MTNQYLTDKSELMELYERFFMSEVQTTVKNKKLVEKRRTQIVLAAIKLFSKNGFHKTTMIEISEEAGLSYGNLYGYLQSKEDILYLIFQYISEVASEELNNAVKNISDPLERLRRMVRAEFNLMDQWSDAILLIYQEGRSLKSPYFYNFLKKEHEHVEKYDHVIKECIKRGQLKSPNTRLAANLIKCMVDAWVLKRWDIRGYADRLEAEKFILDMIINGLGGEDTSVPVSFDSLTGKTVLVVNSGTPISTAIQNFLVSRGARLCSYFEGFIETPKIIKENQSCIENVKFYSKKEHGAITPELFRKIDKECGPIDLFIQDLGIGYLGQNQPDSYAQSKNTDVDPWEVNFSHAYNLSKILLEEMGERHSSRIIYLAPWAWDRFADYIKYKAYVSATIGITTFLSQKLAPYRVNVNCIIPGFIKTPRPSDIQKVQAENVVKDIPCGRFGEMSDVIDAVNFLSGDSSKYLTGQVLRISGGLD